MSIWVVLKSLKKNCQAKKGFSTDKEINDKEYEHVVEVWDRSEMKTMKDYRDLFLKCDVLLLADVFQKFRNDS